MKHSYCTVDVLDIDLSTVLIISVSASLTTLSWLRLPCTSANLHPDLAGFLKTHPGSRSCCLALRDIESALLWIRRNIASFGGDPKRVTLLGHGTGAALVNMLLLADTASGNVLYLYKIFYYKTVPVKVIRMQNSVFILLYYNEWLNKL